MEDIEAAHDRVLMGLKRDSMALTEEEKEVVAFHEGGHAVSPTSSTTPTRSTR